MNNYKATIDRQTALRYMSDEYLARQRRQAVVSAGEQAVVQQVLDAMPAGSVVADVPCGNGRMTRLAAERGLEVVAIDFNLSMLEAMAQRGTKRSMPLERRVRGDITALPLPDKSVDLLLNMRLMHHLPDRATQLAMYREIARVTRSRVVTTFWNARALHWRWHSLRRRIKRRPLRSSAVTPSGFCAICRAAGLEVERIVPLRPWLGEDCVALCRVASG